MGPRCYIQLICQCNKEDGSQMLHTMDMLALKNMMNYSEDPDNVDQRRQL